MKIATLILCLFAPGVVTADIYKWTDENGQVHYGENPNGNPSENIVIPAQDKQTTTPAPDERQRLENIKKWTAARQREREQAKQKQAELKKQKAKQKKQCSKLKNELADLERGGVTWYKLDDAGQRQYMSDEEVEARKNRMRQTIKKNCR